MLYTCTMSCTSSAQVTELECRLSASSSQLSSALEASSQHLERYREAKAEAASLARQLEQVRCLCTVSGSMQDEL